MTTHLTKNGTQTNAVSENYQSDYDGAWICLRLGLFGDALATMEKWRGKGRQGTMGTILDALLIMKQYDRAAEEGHYGLRPAQSRGRFMTHFQIFSARIRGRFVV